MNNLKEFGEKYTKEIIISIVIIFVLYFIYTKYFEHFYAANNSIDDITNFYNSTIKLVCFTKLDKKKCQSELNTYKNKITSFCEKNTSNSTCKTKKDDIHKKCNENSSDISKDCVF